MRQSHKLISYSAPCGDIRIQLPSAPGDVILFHLPSYSHIDYQWNMVCFWLLTGLPGYLIEAEFLDFQTEAHYDELRLGNGHDPADDASVILDGISGEEAPRLVVTDGHLAWISFQSDYTTTKPGFQIALSQVNETGESLSLEGFRGAEI